jgi:hypothetical protein
MASLAGLVPHSRQLSGCFANDHFIDVAPNPLFSGLDGAHDGMVDVAIMFGSVFVLGGIAATDIAAGHT